MIIFLLLYYKPANEIDAKLSFGAQTSSSAAGGNSSPFVGDSGKFSVGKGGSTSLKASGVNFDMRLDYENNNRSQSPTTKNALENNRAQPSRSSLPKEIGTS